MKIIVMFSSFLVTASAQGMIEEWNLYKEKYHKHYPNTTEDQLHMENYCRIKQKIDCHNVRYHQGLETYTMAINKFTDMMPDEFNNLLGFEQRAPWDKSDEAIETYVEPAGANLPPIVDWRTKGALTNVKYQGNCGACYAFATTGALEAHYFLKTGVLANLSNQNLIDCTDSFGNQGCKGGYMPNCYKYIKNNTGISLDSAYPYQGVHGNCRYNSAHKGATLTSYAAIKSNNETALKCAVALNGPIACAINGELLWSYSGGVFKNSNCSPTSLNHAVVIVGYGTSGGMDYWLAKNSWGPDWGENGYLRILRGSNLCGIATYCSYPIV